MELQDMYYNKGDYVETVGFTFLNLLQYIYLDYFRRLEIVFVAVQFYADPKILY